MEQRLRCRPREGRGLYRQPRFVQHRRRHVAVPARGAGCIGVVRKKNNFITLLPSPWGARAASTAIPQYLPKGTEVAVPARGADCIHEVLCGNLRLYVAVPARGAGCITKACEAWLKEHALPSPRGVRVASSLCSMTSTSTTTSCRPREGCGLHQTWNNYWDSISKLPSPRGVRVASSEDCCCYRRFWLPSPRGVRVASQNKVM